MRLYLQERPVTPLYLDLDVRKSDEVNMASDGGGKIPGMEGPFTFRGGRTLHYDPKEGKYYDRGKDMYLDHEEAADATSTQSREEKERDQAKRAGGGGTQTGPRGGEYTMSSSGKKVYKGVDLYLDLSKGGEGSRGGNVIGHTKSGKPIYGSTSWMSSEKLVHQEERPHGVYHVEDQGAGMHELRFQSPRMKSSKRVSWVKGPESTKQAIDRHSAEIKKPKSKEQPDYMRPQYAGAGPLKDVESAGSVLEGLSSKKSIDLYLDLEKGGEGSRGGKVIGHTKSGKPVYESARGAPDTNNVDTFTKVKAKFPGWSKQDHMDAAKLHDNHAEENAGTKTARNSRGWSSVHWDVGGRWTAGQFDEHHAQKGNPHRDPTVGHFISGGAGKAMNGKGQQDMDEFMNSLMDKLPGEEMDKT